ncbi:hypothetical protein ACFRMO_07975 [Streptomyces anulatus]|uniref:DUF7239 family protein n=1 Tax=Streptomyces anulatus TaxID=1892 RepID=UPI0036C12BDD
MSDEPMPFDDPRLPKQPAWVRDGFTNLNSEVLKLRREVEQLRAHVNDGPPDSNTYLTDTAGEDPEDTGRALGRNVQIDFRIPGDEARYPHSIDVRLTDDHALRIECTADLRIEPLAANELLLRPMQ